MGTIVVNNPSSDKSGGSVMAIIGLIILVVFLYLGYVYGLPALRQVQVGAPQINVPSQIDVNVNQTK